MAQLITATFLPRAACFLLLIAPRSRFFAIDDDIIADDVSDEILPDAVELGEEEHIILDNIPEAEMLNMMANTQPNRPQDDEKLMQHAQQLLETQIDEKTHPLLDVQYGIRMTGMWSSYHLEPPKSSRIIDLLKMLFSSQKNQTLLQNYIEKAQKLKKPTESTSQEAIDGTATAPGTEESAATGNKLELVFPLEDDAFLDQIHYEDRDDMGIDISALGVIEKTFARFPAFYFNPRIHCYSPFQNETIVCTLRPVVF